MESTATISEGKVADGVHMVAIFPHKKRQTTAVRPIFAVQVCP